MAIGNHGSNIIKVRAIDGVEEISVSSTEVEGNIPIKVILTSFTKIRKNILD
jgi:hypothetical protein